MKQILFSGQDKDVFHNLEKSFLEHGISMQWVDTAEKTLTAVSEKNIELVILHENQPDMSAKELIEKIIMKNAMINCMVLSAMHEEEFHEIYEGLGVLMQLSLTPSKEDADRIINYLSRINALK